MDGFIELLGLTNCVERAENRIREILISKNCPLRDEGLADLFVPQPVVGLFLGKGGENIKQIKEKAGGNIVISILPEAQPGAGRQVQIAGDPAGQKIARELVAAKIREVVGHHQKCSDKGVKAPAQGSSAPAAPVQSNTWSNWSADSARGSWAQNSQEHWDGGSRT